PKSPSIRAVRDFIFGAFGPARRGALLAFRASSISLASKPRPVSSRQAGQTPRGASEEIFAPHFAQSLVPAVMSPVGQYLVPISTAGNLGEGYARNTAIKWRSSSSISPGTITVWGDLFRQ